MDTQYFPVSWLLYHELARRLAASILSHAKPVDKIVAISRGGLTLGHIMTDFLRITIATFTIQSYEDVQKIGELYITEPLKSPIRGKHVLLVDDVSDTGKTFVRAKKYLSRFRPKEITTVSMFYKPTSVYRPDFFAETTSKWIIFPMEVTETILSITKSLEKQGKSKAEIQKLLYSLGYTPEQIRFARKYYL